jgi:CheY-like chemotaxis protein
MRHLLCILLEKLGYHADSAADGLEALERMKKWCYRLILMDLRMPKMDGYEATRAIRRLEVEEGRNPVPIVAVSSEPDSKMCLEVGMMDSYQKPLLMPELEKLIAKWMGPENVYL